jgi:hypothetical protein
MRMAGPPPLPHGRGEPMRATSDPSGLKIVHAIVRVIGLLLIMLMASIGVGLVVGRLAAAVGTFLILGAGCLFRAWLMPKL